MSPATEDPTRRVTLVDLLDETTALLTMFCPAVWVTGTLTSMRPGPHWSTGELANFDNDGNVISRIDVGFRPGSLDRTATNLTGADVAIFGKLTVHHRYGPLRFEAAGVEVIAEHSNNTTTIAELVEAIRVEGLDQRNKALKLDPDAHRIALICPQGKGAGGQDFLDRLKAGDHHWDLSITEISMGGTNAAQNIASAIGQANRADIDAIVICRGGGAASDLAAFDSPDLAEAIVTSHTPVVMAVGHATDHHVADLVAHTTVPTPSAAAAWLNDRRSESTRHAARLTVETEKARAAAVLAEANRSHQRAVAAERAAIVSRRRARQIALAAVFCIAMFVALVIWIASTNP